MLLSGPYALVALVLSGAGIGKVARPGPPTHALRNLGLPIPESVARLGALAEVGLGAAALASANRAVAVLVATSFLAFAAFIALAVRRPHLVSSCGCFGAEDSPPSLLHMVIDLVLCGVAGAVAARGVVALPALAGDRPLLGALLIGFVCIAAWFVYLTMTALPRVAAEVSHGESGRQ